MRKIIKRLLPPPITTFIQGVRYRGLKAECRQRWRQPGVRRAYLQANRALAAEEVQLAPGLRFRIDPGARTTFEFFGFGEMDSHEEMESFIRLVRGRKLLWDIGALHGIFSLVFCRSNGGRALAAEPSPLAQPILRRNLQLNPELGIQLCPMALGAEPGRLKFHLTWQYANFLPSAENPADRQVHECEVTTLDALLDRGDTPDTLKIDVEGLEAAVLRGGQRLLREVRPLLFLEIHTSLLLPQPGALEEVFGLLTQADYRLNDSTGATVTLANLQRHPQVVRVVGQPQ